MKILITGSQGFVGSNLINSLKNDHKLLCFTSKHKHILDQYSCPHCSEDKKKFQYHYADLTEYEDWAHTVRKFEPEVVIHTAAISSNQHCQSAWMSNVQMTENLISSVSFAGSKPLMIYFSSADVYGENLTFNVNSSSVPHCPISKYGLSKSFCEQLLKMKQDCFSRLVILRPVAMVGPNLTHGVVHDIIKKLKSIDTHLGLFGTNPGSVKPFVHISNIIDMIIKPLLKEDSTDLDVINISNNPVSVLDVANAVMDQMSIVKPIVWSGSNIKNDISPVKMTSHYWLKLHSLESVKQAVKENICEIS